MQLPGWIDPKISGGNAIRYTYPQAYSHAHCTLYGACAQAGCIGLPSASMKVDRQRNDARGSTCHETRFRRAKRGRNTIADMVRNTIRPISNCSEALALAYLQTNCYLANDTSDRAFPTVSGQAIAAKRCPVCTKARGCLWLRRSSAQDVYTRGRGKSS
jgi:hypothetical protein